jgi:hypothetical protein
VLGIEAPAQLAADDHVGPAVGFLDADFCAVTPDSKRRGIGIVAHAGSDAGEDGRRLTGVGHPAEGSRLARRGPTADGAAHRRFGPGARVGAVHHEGQQVHPRRWLVVDLAGKVSEHGGVRLGRLCAYWDGCAANRLLLPPPCAGNDQLRAWRPLG